MRQDVFLESRSGVAQVTLESGGDRQTAGSAFLVPGGLVTNSHVLREVAFDVAVIRFDDLDYASGIRLSYETCVQTIAYESPANEKDVAFLRLDEPEFSGRHVFSFGSGAGLRVGDQVGFLGYPFQMPHLTSHLGYVSSLHRTSDVDVIQVDGSVNGGNSGGPLIELVDGTVVGIVSRAEVGFLAGQMEALIVTLGQNIQLLTRPPGGGRVLVGGVDPVEGLRASQAAMREIAVDLRRSANVGIGYAFSSDHVRDRLAQLSPDA